MCYFWDLVDIPSRDDVAINYRLEQPEEICTDIIRGMHMKLVMVKKFSQLMDNSYGKKKKYTTNPTSNI